MFCDDDTDSEWRGPWDNTYEIEWDRYKRDDSDHNDRNVRLQWRSSAINVQSDAKQPEDNRIVFWTGKLTNPDLINRLSGLSEKRFHRVSGPPEPEVADAPSNFHGIDFLRDGITQLQDGTVRPWNVDGTNNDILDAWDAFFKLAEPFPETELYIFGSLYEPKLDGIHNVHMNQGNTGSHKGENGVHQDGCVIIQDPSGTWWYFFCGFASQKSATNDRTGQAETDVTLAERTGEEDPTGGGVVTRPPPSPPNNNAVKIKSALINPVGSDNTTDETMERVELVNLGAAAVNLAGWSIANGVGEAKALPSESLPGNGATKRFAVGPECHLSNKGGTIQVLDKTGAVVHSVDYDKSQAKPQGDWVQFPSS
jgi:hypothetical protein